MGQYRVQLHRRGVEPILFESPFEAEDEVSAVRKAVETARKSVEAGGAGEIHSALTWGSAPDGIWADQAPVSFNVEVTREGFVVLEVQKRALQVVPRVEVIATRIVRGGGGPGAAPRFEL